MIRSFPSRNAWAALGVLSVPAVVLGAYVFAACYRLDPAEPYELGICSSGAELVRAALEKVGLGGFEAQTFGRYTVFYADNPSIPLRCHEAQHRQEVHELGEVEFAARYGLEMVTCLLNHPITELLDNEDYRKEAVYECYHGVSFEVRARAAADACRDGGAQ